MTFIIQSLDGHERMSIEQLFRPIVEKVQPASPQHAVSGKGKPTEDGRPKHQARTPSSASAYQVVSQLPTSKTVLFAEQIMTTPVITLSLQAKLSTALEIFQTRPFRHLPVISDHNRLAGIISDRDVMRYLGGFTEDFRQQAPHRSDDNIEHIMQSHVLAASKDTDVRHIARLFVEQHVGSMPIVTNGELTGIVTRSDILNAVMRHFVLELWA
ncbi:hypothetical protein MNBD_GAMMA15-1814 [hydrothermal vent metagenome]|uniref:CBS domain-containing protein n=1 Tax=hydrothermal vent metagenome TaxID=652676 RepID=A0A3B0YDD0_9ZZZZ